MGWGGHHNGRWGGGSEDDCLSGLHGGVSLVSDLSDSSGYTRKVQAGGEVPTPIEDIGPGQNVYCQNER
jgi:hypothetical protein